MTQTQTQTQTQTPTAAPDTARLLEGLREQTAGFARAVAGQDPDTPVPTCPDWPLRTLVGHVGQEHRWAADILRNRGQLPVPNPWEADPGTPDAWAAWLREGARELTDAVRDIGADTEIETFIGRRPALFWLRRMLGDTCVHHYDAASATGATFGVAADLAAEVITENLTLLATPAFAALRPKAAELRGEGERIGLVPGRQDPSPGWLITRTPEGPRWERGRANTNPNTRAQTRPQTHARPQTHVDVVVSGEVDDLMLLLSRRIPPEGHRVTVTGDAALLTHWLAHTAL
ncbi:maleylpyruvate isomerase family mycothiol-dependent enzyme [Streptomyces arenae]|nr:maleylpyruvate isomerase family mycothiol-dependent enzyme [Streptomyces arenae]